MSGSGVEQVPTQRLCGGYSVLTLAGVRLQSSSSLMFTKLLGN